MHTYINTYIYTNKKLNHVAGSAHAIMPGNAFNFLTQSLKLPLNYGKFIVSVNQISIYKKGDSKTWFLMLVPNGKEHLLIYMHLWVYVLYVHTYTCAQSCMHLCVHRRVQVCIHVCLDGSMCCYVALLYVIIDWIKPMRKTLFTIQIQTSQLCRKLQNMVV